MKELQKYIRESLVVIFSSIFLPLFSIASIVFLIKLATYTAVIQLSLWDMAKLYFFIMPELLFYTLPIAFFVAATLTLFKLSNDNEIVVIFALGIKPKVILKALFQPALFLSLILLFNFLVLFPHTKILSKNFIIYKKSEAKFNLSASEFGHKFGEWLLYIGKDNPDETYSDVVLFNKNQEEEILIEAERAEIINDSGILRLKLTTGEGYSYSTEKFTQIEFDTMFINDTMQSDLYIYKSAINYWLDEDFRERRIKMFTTSFIMALFPLLSLYLIASIGIVHVRQQKGKVYLSLFLGILIYYAATLGLQGPLSFYTIPVVLITWIASTYIMYKKTIVANF